MIKTVPSVQQKYNGDNKRLVQVRNTCPKSNIRWHPHLFPLVEPVLANPHDARGQTDVVRSVALGATQQNLVQDLSFEPQECLLALSNVTRAAGQIFEETCGQTREKHE